MEFFLMLIFIMLFKSTDCHFTCFWGEPNAINKWLFSDLPLSSFEYTHQCLKMGKDIKFEMINKQEVAHPFLRTVSPTFLLTTYHCE